MIDSHCHLDAEPFDSGRDELLQQCAQQGITDIVIPGIEPVQWPRIKQLADSCRAPRLHATVGLHPWWLAGQDGSIDVFAGQLRQAAQASIAIGECGLDGAIEIDMAVQQDWLRVHLQLACDLGKPLILHAHKAHNEMLSQLKHYRPAAGGVIHGFAGSTELAQQYWRLGFYLGVGGTITYDRARKTRTAVKAMPMASLLLETDAPDMPLCGAQGRPNSPLQLPRVAACLAELKNESLSAVCEHTALNTRKLFGI